MYQDCFEKPSELVLYRDSKDGGLGLLNVKIRSLALLIRSFLETSVHPQFRHSLLHEILFRYHIQGETSLPNPGVTPYYDKNFFETIRHYHETCPLNIKVMTTSQWYSVLLEDQVLMAPADANTTPNLLPVKVETLHPLTDWSLTWRLARTKGLGSDLTGFLFKLVHCLLPTQDRVSRLGGSSALNPGLCLHCAVDVEDPAHAFFFCQHSRQAGHVLLGHVQVLVPDLTPEAALRLEFAEDLSHDEELATTCLLAAGLKYIWESRVHKKQVTIYKMRAEVEARISILRRTRHRGAGDLMLDMLSR